MSVLLVVAPVKRNRGHLPKVFTYSPAYSLNYSLTYSHTYSFTYSSSINSLNSLFAYAIYLSRVLTPLEKSDRTSPFTKPLLTDSELVCCPFKRPSESASVERT